MHVVLSPPDPALPLSAPLVLTCLSFCPVLFDPLPPTPHPPLPSFSSGILHLSFLPPRDGEGLFDFVEFAYSKYFRLASDYHHVRRRQSILTQRIVQNMQMCLNYVKVHIFKFY